MRVITESEGVRVEADERGRHYIWAPDRDLPLSIAPSIPTEALLAIVADRYLREGINRARASNNIWTAMALQADQNTGKSPVVAARSPDTKQEEGR